MSRQKGRTNGREAKKNCAENRWTQNSDPSKRCRVCGLEARSTYFNAMTGRQVWAHSKLKDKPENYTKRRSHGHPWGGKFKGKITETIYHEEGQEKEAARAAKSRDGGDPGGEGEVT